jgi:TRAP-type C4-dicarboxylate transport system substrate-binding protein
MPGRFVVTQIAELPGLDADAEQCSIAYQRIQERVLVKAGEHKGVKLLSVFCHGAGVLHSRQPVTSIEQMKGLKIRNGGGVGAEVGNALGFTSVPAPASKVYEILSQGVADGTLMPTEVQATFKLKEVTPHMLILPGGFYYGSFFMIMNPAKFNRLSKADQAAIDRVSGQQLAAVAGKYWAAGDKLGLNEAKAAGTKITEAPPALAKQIRDKLAHLERDWLEKASKKGIDAKAALQALRDEVKKLKTKS